MKLKKYFYICLYFLLNSCATTPNTHYQYWRPYAHQPLDFHGSGRLAIKIDNRGSYGNFTWENIASQQLNTININTPIGNTIGQLCKDSLGIVAKNNKGEVVIGNNSSELSKSLLGFEVPLDHLDLWVNGYIPTQLPYQLSGNILSQNNWQVERVLNQDSTVKKLILQREELQLTIIFDDWSTINQPDSKSRLCPGR